ncbi:MAG TPA: hypothetical protein VF812_07565 [Ktedonobacterales bacterium]
MTAPTHERPHAPQPHSRKTVRNVLIGIAIAAVALPVALLGLLWLGMVIQEQQRVSVGDAYTAVGRYYQALQRQDYSTAYSYVDQHATLLVDGRAIAVGSVDALATAARALDQRDGTITAYRFTDGVFEQGKNVVDMTVAVTRSTSVYDVHIQMAWVGGDQLFVNKDKWKMLQADGI